jgi:hypothetical protein
VTGERADALGVPRGAVSRMGQKAVVWTVNGGRSEREVTTGSRTRSRRDPETALESASVVAQARGPLRGCAGEPRCRRRSPGRRSAHPGSHGMPGSGQPATDAGQGRGPAWHRALAGASAEAVVWCSGSARGAAGAHGPAPLPRSRAVDAGTGGGPRPPPEPR